MPKFSYSSFTKLSTCHQDLQALFYEVIKYFDCAIIGGYRNEFEQEKAFDSGNSKVNWPDSSHNKKPSLAVDAAPYDLILKTDWKDLPRFHYFAGFVMGIAIKLKDDGKITHSIRWGGDWDKDTQIKDEKFRDLCHYELIV